MREGKWEQLRHPLSVFNLHQISQKLNHKMRRESKKPAKSFCE